MILYTAAHGGFLRESVPLGGGAAVYEHLVAEWSRTCPFPFRTITPAILGSSAPDGRDLVRFNERDYARFSREFERAATEEILRHDPADTVVLANDISEGPDFRLLGEKGYRLFTIFHVDVVAYVAEIYFRGLVKPETTVRWARRLPLPALARLVWEKQQACVRYSAGIVVPSEGMRDVILRCYPDCPREKIHVLPWGSWDLGPPVPADELRREFGVLPDARVLLTLSRISPEKGQDILLEALRDWKPDYPVWLFICGDAAFMQGRRFLEKLRDLAGKLSGVRVVFPGYVTGERKRAFFSLADLYVFPSRHESYGLTLLEALGSGLPAVCVDTLGARSVMRDEFGALVPASGLRAAIERILPDDALRKRMGEAARAFAANQRFDDRAAQLAQLLTA